MPVKWTAEARKIYTEKNILGVKYELKVLNLLIDKYKYTIIKKSNNNYKYDIIYKTLDNKIIKAEIKADLQATKYNNYFIEFEQNHKPSGILTTEADFYIICDSNNEVIIINTTVLKFLIEHHIYKRIADVNITVPTKGYLISCDVLKLFCLCDKL